jgi:hypothetical protein
MDSFDVGHQALAMSIVRFPLLNNRRTRNQVWRNLQSVYLDPNG